MMTSSFSISGTDPNGVCIARFPPRFIPFKGPKYIDLAPSKLLLKAWKSGTINEKEYTDRFYQETLSRTTPGKVLQDLGEESILLCYEKPGQFCHRQLVGKWLEEALGIAVPEKRLQTGKNTGDQK
jgi:uncharacterized protein YeaO (DUF488 family)